MNTLDTEFHRRLAKKIDDELQGKITNLVAGAQDHETYKHSCGYLKALSDVAEWCGEIEQHMNEGK